MLEFDHLDGFARTRSHDPERIVLRCRGHDQHEAETDDLPRSIGAPARTVAGRCCLAEEN